MAIFCVAALSSCVEVNMSSEGKKIKPSSNFKTVEYQQKAFHEIDLNIVATVEFVQGNESKVVLTAPDNYIELFKFENKDGELDVAFARRNINIEGKNVHMTIYSPTLSSLNNSGVSNVSIKKLTAESLELDNSGVGSINIKDLQVKTVDVDCSGVGNVTLAGSAASADLDCSGVGSIHAADLEAQTVEADVSGVGGIQCWATESIKGDVSGNERADIGDITLLIDYTLGKDVPLDEFQTEAADVNNDGIVDIDDVTMLIDMVLGR